MKSSLKNLFFVLLWNYAVSQNFPPSQLNYYPGVLAPIHASIETSSLFPYQTRQSTGWQRVRQNPAGTNAVRGNTYTSHALHKPSNQFADSRWSPPNIRKTTPENLRKSTEFRRYPIMPPVSDKMLLPHDASPTNMLPQLPSGKQTFIRNQSPEVSSIDSERSSLVGNNLGNSAGLMPSSSNRGNFNSASPPLQPKEVFQFTRKQSNIPVTNKPVSLKVNEVNRNHLIPSFETRLIQGERIRVPTNEVPSTTNTKLIDTSNIPHVPLRYPTRLKSTLQTNPSHTTYMAGNTSNFTDDTERLQTPKIHKLSQPGSDDKSTLEILKQLNEEDSKTSLSDASPLGVNDEKLPDTETEHPNTEVTTNAPTEQSVVVNEDYSKEKDIDPPEEHEMFDTEVFHANNKSSHEAPEFPTSSFIQISGTPEEIRMLKVIDAINNFGLILYGKIQNNTNLFFSPLSLTEVMAIILEGATNMTATQLMNGLHFTASNIRQDEVRLAFEYLLKSIMSRRSSYEFENANLILLKNNCPFKSEFSSNVYKYYKPLLGSVDFASYGVNIMRSVNDWVTKRTHGKINEFLNEPLSPSTVLAILNAVYFRGRWKNPFQPLSTHKDTFYNYGHQPVQVDMMLQSSVFNTAYSHNLDTRAIELQYYGEEASMVILLPDKRNGIQHLKRHLNYRSLNDILNSMKRRSLILSLPKFSVQVKHDMGDVFKEMGMRDMFIPGKSSFGKMTNTSGLYVTNVYHEAAIDVDENGTEASAVSGVSIVPLSARQKIEVDHPFVFVIRNKINGLILFIGQLNTFTNTE